MESLDYRYFTIHKNKHTTRLSPDGTARLAVAHRDPGVPNFIDISSTSLPAAPRAHPYRP